MPKLRPLLPKTPSMTRPEPFLLKLTPLNTQESGCTQIDHSKYVASTLASTTKAHGKVQTEFERCSIGQKKQREREFKENQNKSKEPRPMNPHRSAALGGGSTNLPPTSNIYYKPEDTRIFILELKLYEGESKKWIDSHPSCNPMQALDLALDHEYEVNEPRHQERFRESYRTRMLR
ncbi:hypothetical protein B0H13DRAFT_1909811 [Mycena leptocephala]|nr:hypothetical protein B0H13DRAFT_1909811 [Mycena leptocephala]